jgi:tetratricopeptide (TPR) repeat protein
MRSRAGALAAAVVCALVAIYLGLQARDAATVRDADRLARGGQWDRAIAGVRDVTRAPSDLRALVVRARSLTALQRRDAADAAWRRVARRDPNNWQVHYEWARAVGLLGGDPAAATRHYDRARELNPQLPPLPEPQR